MIKFLNCTSLSDHDKLTLTQWMDVINAEIDKNTNYGRLVIRSVSQDRLLVSYIIYIAFYMLYIIVLSHLVNCDKTCLKGLGSQSYMK